MPGEREKQVLLNSHSPGAKVGPSGCGPGKLAMNLKVKPNEEWGEPERSAGQAL